MKTSPLTDQNPIAYGLKELGELIRTRRYVLGLSLVDASASVRVSTSTMSRLENGKAVRTDSLVKVLNGLGLVVGARPKRGIRFALDASGQNAEWQEVNGGPTSAQKLPPLLDSELPIFFASHLRITLPRTPEDVRRAIAEGRFAEMSPGLAGDDDDES
ncbi:helix-turn-helix domain-containing protein [Massilia sp. TWR1-2-2]|uniref:helix-turn-helix domain-containing protein n=1 Tax=Massilia sp. TWR1-2-2 TaxID=2804584 RepID=UPI003CF1F405